ncbi:MAG: uroporphyrinogen decarboxylase family protein [Candidatus Brocadiaceae bacterium]|jgi:uroporphyrinogen decarboxylase
MKSRERVRRALSHEEPDRVPIDLGGTFLSSAPPEMQERIVEVLGLEGEPDPRFDEFDDRIQRHFGCDLRSIRPARGARWGFRDVHDAPLRHATLEDLESYPWPGPNDDMVRGLREKARWLHEETDYFICAAQIGQGIFELGCWLRGYDRILLDLALDREFVHALNRHILHTNVRLGDLYFAEIGPYVDMVLIGDDLATQDGPYMSPQTFRELIKPYFRDYIESIRQHCPDAFIAHHCCGSSFPLLDDLQEIGVQVVNPVQTRAAEMEPENLARKKGGLSFHGGVDLQYILPHGTVGEVEEFVRDLIRHLAPGGGYVVAACHSLPEDVKPENVVAMLDAARRWGEYPLGV